MPDCPKCNAPMVQRTNSQTGQAFWGCPRFPDCRGTRPIVINPEPFDVTELEPVDYTLVQDMAKALERFRIKLANPPKGGDVLEPIQDEEPPKPAKRKFLLKLKYLGK